MMASWMDLKHTCKKVVDELALDSLPYFFGKGAIGSGFYKGYYTSFKSNADNSVKITIDISINLIAKVKITSGFKEKNKVILSTGDSEFDDLFCCYTNKRFLETRGDFSLSKNIFGHSFDEKLDGLTAMDAPDMIYLVALLTEKTRKALLNLRKYVKAIKITNRKFLVTIPSDSDLTYKEIVDLISTMININKNMLETPDIKQNLIENLIKDTCSKMRFQSLQMLNSHYMFDKKVDNAVIKAMDDEDITIQILAAKNSEDAGLQKIDEILKSTVKLNYKTTVNLIDFLLMNSYKKVVKSFPIRFALESELETRKYLMQGMKELNYRNYKEFLLKRLSIDKGLIVSELVKDLGEYGDLDSIEHIQKTIEREATIGEVGFRTISRIQDRFGINREKGWLSTVELTETDGALSISEEASEGALSMEEEKR